MANLPDPSNHFMTLMLSNFNDEPNLPLGLTENKSTTYLTSGDPCVDFFFQVVPSTPSPTVTTLLETSWAHDPLTTLKLICHLRGVRGTGKSDKESFYTAALWLHRNHPQTLCLNLPTIVRFGYLKDPLEILYRLLYGPDVRKFSKESNRGAKKRRLKRSNKARRERPREERLEEERKRMEEVMAKAREDRKIKREAMRGMLQARYYWDHDFRALHDATTQLFIDMLTRDLRSVREGSVDRVSLAAKWCPSLDSSYDFSTSICEHIARWMFPREMTEEYCTIKDEHYAYRVRDRLRKEVLVPLRRILELPEVYISAREWNLLPYKRVASVAMKNYNDLFLKHDKARFLEYLSGIRSGTGRTARIATEALLPHEIIASLLIPLHYYCHNCSEEEEEQDDDKVDDDEVAELQWINMVKRLSLSGFRKLPNSIAVCDVSGSMKGTPMDVCISLGLLTSELSKKPWKGKVITFSERPMILNIVGNSLREKATFVKKMQWGTQTDFQKVFDQILKVAVEGKLDPKDMVKRVYVFSDMEFDKASGARADQWETDYMVIERKFREFGYGEVVPEIVFWNLRDSRSIPVAADKKGVALVSGFSRNLMTVFLEEGGLLRPVDFMNAAISGEEYKGLDVVD